MRKRSGQVHSRESSATLQLTVSLLYPQKMYLLLVDAMKYIIIAQRYVMIVDIVLVKLKIR